MPSPRHSLVTCSLGHRLLGWGDLYSGSLPHGLDPGLLLLGALGTEEVGADPGVLSLWGEAVRGTVPSLVHPAHSHLWGEDTHTHRTGGQAGRSPDLQLFAPYGAQGNVRRPTAVPSAPAGIQVSALTSSLDTTRQLNSQVS